MNIIITVSFTLAKNWDKLSLKWKSIKIKLLPVCCVVKQSCLVLKLGFNKYLLEGVRNLKKNQIYYNYKDTICSHFVNLLCQRSCVIGCYSSLGKSLCIMLQLFVNGIMVACVSLSTGFVSPYLLSISVDCCLFLLPQKFSTLEALIFFCLSSIFVLLLTSEVLF